MDKTKEEVKQEEPVIVRYELVHAEGELTLMVELSNGDMDDIGTAFDEELDEVGVLEYIGRTCRGHTVEEVQKQLHEQRVALFHAVAGK